MSNSLATVHPELIVEWSDRNLPLTPDSVTFGSNKKVWRKGACGHEWETSIKARSSGEKCPICSGARVIEGINDLSTLKPELASAWSEKNEIKPTEVSIGSHKKVIWKCKLEHEWIATVKSRSINRTGCPYCSHNKVLEGFNDLATVFPYVVDEWSDRNEKKPTEVTAFANSKAWWKCKTCGYEWNTLNRLGTVFFLFVFNIGISIFVFLLTGIMIFSQVLFIIYAMFLPVSFILSMIPSFDGMSKRAITKLFNTILTRAGITLIITTAFSISTMLYTLSAGYPFFLIAFLQIVTFAGIYFKLGDLMSMFSLQSNDSQSVGSRVMRKPRMLMHAHMHRLQRKLGRSMTTLGAGSAIVTGKKGQSGSGSSARTQADHSRPDGKEKSTLGKRIGQTIGTVADTKDRMVDTASGLKEQVKDLPTNARYAVYQGKSKVKENVRDLTSSISQTKADRASGRKEQQEQRRKTIAKRRSEMEQVKQKKQPASSVHERPTTRQEQYHDEQTSKQSNIQTSYKESQQAKQERPAVKSDFSSPKVERQGNTVQEKTVQKPATSTTTADRTSQRPITKERPSTVQRVPLQNTRSRPPIKTATIKKVGKKP